MPHAGAVGHTRHEDERNRGGGRLIAERREREIAVHSFHVDIAEDEVGQFLAGNLDANRAVLGFDHVKSLLTQCQLNHFAQPFFVVNDQNFFHVNTLQGYDTHHPLVYKDCWPRTLSGLVAGYSILETGLPRSFYQPPLAPPCSDPPCSHPLTCQTCQKERGSLPNPAFTIQKPGPRGIHWVSFLPFTGNPFMGGLIVG